jgi:hypothetical protein
MAKIAKLNLTQKQKALHHQTKQDFTQHELENMNLSNHEIKLAFKCKECSINVYISCKSCYHIIG